MSILRKAETEVILIPCDVNELLTLVVSLLSSFITVCYTCGRHMRRMPKACASKLCGTAQSNQIVNKYFVCRLSGSQLMWQIYLYLPGPTGKIR